MLGLVVYIDKIHIIYNTTLEYISTIGAIFTRFQKGVPSLRKFFTTAVVRKPCSIDRKRARGYYREFSLIG